MNKVFPYHDINVQDGSLEFLDTTIEYPLFRPIFAIKSQKGDIGEPVYYPEYKNAVAVLGAETFNKNNPDFACRDIAFIKKIFQKTGCWIIRLGGLEGEAYDPITSASMLLEATVDTGAKTISWDSRPLGADTVDDLTRNQHLLSNAAVTGATAFSGTPVELAGHEAVGNEYTGDIQIHGDIVDGNLSIALINADTDLSPMEAFTFQIFGAANLGALNYVSGEHAYTSMPGDPEPLDVVAVSSYSNGVTTVKINVNTDMPADTTDVYVSFNFANTIPTTATIKFQETSYIGWKFFQTKYTVTQDGSPVFTIPFMAFEAIYKGAYGNEYGISLETDLDSLNYADLTSIKNVMYNLGFVHQASGDSSVTKVLNQFQTEQVSFALDSETINPATSNTMDLGLMMDTYWSSLVPTPLTPTVFEQNVKFLQKLIGEMASAANHQVLIDIMDERPGSIDLFNMQTKFYDDSDADPANHAIKTLDLTDGAVIGLTVVDNAAANSGAALSGDSAGVNIMLEGGSDGYLDFEGQDLDVDASGIMAENRAKIWSLDVNPAIQDKSRYPFNMLIDTGYPMTVKKAMITMLGVREDVKPVLTTWSGSDMDMGESVLAGQTLLSDIQMYPESVVFGTTAFQAVILGQTAYPTDTALYRKPVPATWWYVDSCATNYNLQYIKGHPGAGKTNSIVKSMFGFDWRPYTDTQWRLLWDASVNYAQSYDNEQLHYATIKSAYEYESSVFVNDSFVNTTLFCKQLLPQVWANHAGRDESNDVVYSDALIELDAKLDKLLNGRYKFKTRMYQTAPDKKAGFVHRIAIELYSEVGQRIWHFSIIGKRLTASS